MYAWGRASQVALVKGPAGQCRRWKRRGFDPWVRKTPPPHPTAREGNGNTLQYSCLENPIDRGAWWTIVHRVAQIGQDWSDLVRTHTPEVSSVIWFLTRLFGRWKSLARETVKFLRCVEKVSEKTYSIQSFINLKWHSKLYLEVSDNQKV